MTLTVPSRPSAAVSGRRRRGVARLAGRIAVLAGGVFAAVMLVEALHALAPGAFPEALRVPSGYYAALMVPDGTLAYRLRPDVDVRYEAPDYVFEWQTTAEGWRAPGDGALTGQPCAVTAGDSFTFAQGVEGDQTWSAGLERQLGCRVANLGVPGYGALAAARVLEQMSPVYRPRVALLGLHLGSDFVDSEFFARCEEAYGGRPLEFEVCVLSGVGRADWKVSAVAALGPAWPAFTALGRRSVTVRLLNHVRSRLGPPPRVATYKDGSLSLVLSSHWWQSPGWGGASGSLQLGLVEQALAQAKLRLEGIGATLFVVLMPYREQVYWHLVRELLDPPAGFDPDEPRALAHRAASAAGLPVIDLTEPLRAAARRGVQLYFAHEDHWTVAGNDVAAEAVARSLRERGLAVTAPARPAARGVAGP